MRRPMVAIVGSRNASAAGLAFAERLARELVEADYVIVSGLARGIDARAHRASLAGGTVSTLAGGLDKIYPAEHVSLAEEIAVRGALLSEMPMGWEPRGRDFPRRNRIVSGLSLATIVVEAALRSGSLITARFANEQGREVFAAPGSPLDPRAEGANDLLRQGATICTRAADVIDALAPLVAQGLTHRPRLLEETEPVEPSAEPLWEELDLFGAEPAPLSTAGLELDERTRTFQQPTAQESSAQHAAETRISIRDRITELLGPSPVAVDELVRVAEASVADVQVALLDLELDGLLERHGGNLVSKITVGKPHS
jgi:DNA processing protein